MLQDLYSIEDPCTQTCTQLREQGTPYASAIFPFSQKVELAPSWRYSLLLCFQVENDQNLGEHDAIFVGGEVLAPCYIALKTAKSHWKVERILEVEFVTEESLLINSYTKNVVIELRIASKVEVFILGMVVEDFGPVVPIRTNTELLGDSTCLYNAKSPYLQCAIAPTQDCKTCQHYSKNNDNY